MNQQTANVTPAKDKEPLAKAWGWTMRALSIKTSRWLAYTHLERRLHRAFGISESRFFGRTAGPLTLWELPLLIMVAAFLACYLPARSAAIVDQWWCCDMSKAGVSGESSLWISNLWEMCDSLLQLQKLPGGLTNSLGDCHCFLGIRSRYRIPFTGIPGFNAVPIQLQDLRYVQGQRES